MREQRLGRHPTVDWTVRRGRLHDSLLAAPAAVTRPADHPHPELGGHIIQHLGPIFADDVQRSAATGTGLIVDVHDDLDPRQIRRQSAAIALRLGATRVGRSGTGFRRRRIGRWKHRVEPGLLFGHGLLKVFLALLQRRVVELFRPAAEPVAAQAGELQL
jgi:hypothetical protein